MLRHTFVTTMLDAGVASGRADRSSPRRPKNHDALRPSPARTSTATRTTSSARSSRRPPRPDDNGADFGTTTRTAADECVRSEPCRSHARPKVVRRLLNLLATSLAVVGLNAGCVAATDNEVSPRGVASFPSGSASARVKVELNHCFVGTVSFDGEKWNVPFNKQFGWGGTPPKGWRGAGVMVRTGQSEARFEDDGGAVLVFKRLNDPSVQPMAKALCD